MSAMRLRTALAALVVPAALLPLAGCGPARNEFAPACPVAQLVPALADLTRFSGNGRDITDLVVQARITAVQGQCMAGKTNDTLAANVAISIGVQRGPAMQGRDVDVPVFVAVTQAGEVLDKQMLPVTINFPPNVDRVTLTSKPIELALPVGSGVSGASYRIIAGFQLTPDEIDMNRRVRAR